MNPKPGGYHFESDNDDAEGLREEINKAKLEILMSECDHGGASEDDEDHIWTLQQMLYSRRLTIVGMDDWKLIHGYTYEADLAQVSAVYVSAIKSLVDSEVDGSLGTCLEQFAQLDQFYASVPPNADRVLSVESGNSCIVILTNYYIVVDAAYDNLMGNAMCSHVGLTGCDSC